MYETRALFARKKIRCTRQRLDVYSALAASRRHPTAEELHRMVQSESPGSSLATVYNTLEALCDVGLCQKIITTAGVARYDADISNHLHVVSNDGSVLDVPEELADRISDSLPADVRSQLCGLCNGSKASHLSIRLGV